MANKIYIGNLPFSATEEDLKGLLSKFQSMISVSLIMDKFSGRSKGFAFAEFEAREDMDGAIAELNGQDLGGRALRVNEAEDRPREDRPRGGFGDRKPGGFRSGGGDRPRSGGGGAGGPGGGRRDGGSRSRW